jgi:hypothetical protein
MNEIIPVEKDIENNYVPVNLGTTWNDIVPSLGKPEDNANKREIFAQNAAPTAGFKEGDLWFDTDDNNKIYRANSALTWISVQDGTAASKVTSFAQASAPTALTIGDLWIDTDDNNKLYRATAVGAANWVAVNDPTATIILSGATIGGWSINATSIYTGTEDHSGYTANAGDITLYSDGIDASIHGNKFYIDNAGKLTCTDIVATGTINAEGGYLASGVYIGASDALLCESAGLNVSTAGHIRGGQTDYNTGEGFFLGYSGGKYKQSIGNSADTSNQILWDGTNLYVNGSRISNEHIHGNGIDGDVTISGDTTLTRDWYYNNLTINANKTFNPAGFRYFVKGVLTNNGIISGVGNNGGVGGNGGNGESSIYGTPPGGASGTAGTAGAALADGSIPGGAVGIAGGTGAVGATQNDGSATNGGAGSGGGAGTIINKSLGSAGSTGSAGGAGGASGGPGYWASGGAGGGAGNAGSQTGTIFNKIYNVVNAINLYDILPLSGGYGQIEQLKGSAGAGGSGGGGGGGANGNQGGGSGGGGGGAGGSGGNGRMIFISARTLINNGVITVAGGNGANGGNGGNGGAGDNDSGFDAPGGGAGGGGAGGSGGTGGVIILIFGSKSGSGTYVLTGGTAGTAGVGGTGGAPKTGAIYTAGANGTAGTNGVAGATGIKYELQV